MELRAYSVSSCHVVKWLVPVYYACKHVLFSCRTCTKRWLKWIRANQRKSSIRLGVSRSRATCSGAKLWVRLPHSAFESRASKWVSIWSREFRSRVISWRCHLTNWQLHVAARCEFRYHFGSLPLSCVDRLRLSESLLVCEWKTKNNVFFY